MWRKALWNDVFPGYCAISCDLAAMRGYSVNQRDLYEWCGAAENPIFLSQRTNVKRAQKLNANSMQLIRILSTTQHKIFAFSRVLPFDPVLNHCHPSRRTGSCYFPLHKGISEWTECQALLCFQSQIIFEMCAATQKVQFTEPKRYKTAHLHSHELMFSTK